MMSFAISAASRWISNQLFLPDEGVSRVDAIRVMAPSPANPNWERNQPGESGCPICMDPVFDLQKEGFDSRVLVHQEPRNRNHHVHSYHAGCLLPHVRANAAAEPILQCPDCRADINYASVARELGLPNAQVVPKTWAKRLVEELPLIAWRIRQYGPYLRTVMKAQLVVSAAFSFLQACLSYESAIFRVSGTLAFMPPWLVGTAIGVTMSLILAETILSLGINLTRQISLRTTPQKFFIIVLACGSGILAYKIAIFIAPILVSSSLARMLVSSNPLIAAIQKGHFQGSLAAGPVTVFAVLRLKFAGLGDGRDYFLN
jgi:hypothetical protein